MLRLLQAVHLWTRQLHPCRGKPVQVLGRRGSRIGREWGSSKHISSSQSKKVRRASCKTSCKTWWTLQISASNNGTAPLLRCDPALPLPDLPLFSRRRLLLVWVLCIAAAGDFDNRACAVLCEVCACSC